MYRSNQLCRSKSMGEIAVSRMVNTQLRSRIKGVVGFRPRTGQVEAIHRLIVDQKGSDSNCTDRLG